MNDKKKNKDTGDRSFSCICYIIQFNAWKGSHICSVPTTTFEYSLTSIRKYAYAIYVYLFYLQFTHRNTYVIPSYLNCLFVWVDFFFSRSREINFQISRRMVARALLISHYTQCVPDTANNHVRSSSNKVARARPSSARAETRQKKNEEHQQPHTSWLPFADVALFGFEWKEIVIHRIMNLCLNKIPKPYIRCTHKWVKRKTWTVLERKHQVILFIIVIIVMMMMIDASVWGIIVTVRWVRHPCWRTLAEHNLNLNDCSTRAQRMRQIRPHVCISICSSTLTDFPIYILNQLYCACVNHAHHRQFLYMHWKSVFIAQLNI